MGKIIKTAPTILFIIGVFGLGQLVGSQNAVWYLAALSIVFVWGHVSLVKGNASSALAIVLIVTVIIPVVILFAIGMPVYKTWLETANSLYSSFRDHGQFQGLELFVPFLAAVLSASILRGSNKSLKNGTPESGAP